MGPRTAFLPAPPGGASPGQGASTYSPPSPGPGPLWDCLSHPPQPPLCSGPSSPASRPDSQPSTVASGAQVSPVRCVRAAWSLRPGQWVDVLPCPAPCSWRPQMHHTEAGRPCQGKGGRPARPWPWAWRPVQSLGRPFPSRAPDTEGNHGMAQPQGAHPPGALSPRRQQPTEPTHTTAWSDCRKNCSETGSKTGGENRVLTCVRAAHGEAGTKDPGK